MMGAVLSTLSIEYNHHFSYKLSINISSDEEDFETFFPILSTVGVEIVTISSDSETD